MIQVLAEGIVPGLLLNPQKNPFCFSVKTLLEIKSDSSHFRKWTEMLQDLKGSLKFSQVLLIISFDLSNSKQY